MLFLVSHFSLFLSYFQKQKIKPQFIPYSVYSLERLDLLCNEDEWTELKAYGNVNNYHSHSHM